MKKLIVIAAVMASCSVSATDLSVGYSELGSAEGFALKIGTDNFITAFTYTKEKTVDAKIDNTGLSIAYRIPVVAGFEVYPLIGGAFYTTVFDKGGSESDSQFIYGGGLRYTFDSTVLIDYSIQVDEYDSLQSVSIGYAF